MNADKMNEKAMFIFCKGMKNLIHNCRNSIEYHEFLAEGTEFEGEGIENDIAKISQ